MIVRGKGVTRNFSELNVWKLLQFTGYDDWVPMLEWIERQVSPNEVSLV